MLCKQTMIDSYNWTSFSPEKRGEADYNYYANLLVDDLATLLRTQDSTGNYSEKFQGKVMTIFHRQARCASPMITGPANFNNRRNGKAWDSRDKAVDEFNHWRNRYLNAVTRERTLSPEAETDKTVEELERMEIKHEFYKAMNKIKDLEAKRAFAIEHDELKIFEYWNDSRFQGTIPSFHLTNHNNKIKARREKLEVMASRIETKSEWQKIEFKGGYVDIENDRVVIKHDEKPSKEVIEVIKRNGFKYSPKTVSWVRKHTENAVHVVKTILPKLGGI
jgi:frataxin-like iron-binding protein CyaY